MRWWLLLVVCVGPAATECPAVCACVDHDIDCRSRSITQVPTEGVSPHVTSWDLSHNNLTSLPHDAFHHSDHTMAVDLSCNRIANVSSIVFSHLERLVSINLSENNITYIDFKHMKSDRLHALYLSHNPHLRLPERGFDLRHLKVLEMKHCRLTIIISRFFARMQRLEVLDLGGNRLSALEGHTFTHLKQLVYLDLSGNKFVTLPSGVLHQLDVSVHVKLGDNRFVCECKTHHAYTSYVTHRSHAPLYCSYFDAQSQTEPLSHLHFADFFREHCTPESSAPETSQAVPARGSPVDHRGVAVAASLSAILVAAIVVTVVVKLRRNVRLRDLSPQRFSILKGSDEV